MGGKESKKLDSAQSFLNPNERKKLKQFLDSKGNKSDSINVHEIKKIWEDLLVRDLLNTYTGYLISQYSANKDCIDLEHFVLLYGALVKGDNETQALCITALVSTSDKPHLVPFNSLCKYLSDLLESYIKVASYQNDAYCKSWTHMKQPDRAVIDVTVRGICNDLPKLDDNVNVSDLERWLNYSGLVRELHIHVVGSMYNLQPEELSTLVPMAHLPITKIPTILDLSQVILLNSLIPFENKSEWRLLFSTSIHGESFAKFVGCIVNQGPLLIVLECNRGNKFGGFISENINVGPRWVGTDDSILFKLIPRTEVFASTCYNNHYAYLNMNQNSLPNGLGMGGQFDYWGLWIDSQFGQGECSESCSTYRKYKMLAGSKKFNIRKLEVWGVGDPPLSAEEKGERGSVSILDKDAAASHILEMAGRQAHSKGLRDEPN